MSPAQGVPWFGRFHEYDPSSPGFTCIYFTKKGARCPLEVNNAKLAAELRRRILTSPSKIQESDLIKTIKTYICCICCNDAAEARHRDRIEDDNILVQLVGRWTSEIRQRCGLPTSSSLLEPKPCAPEPEFRPRLREPGRRDTVSHKMLEALKKRDNETGSLYIFERPSSPGYVKIGWTADNVSKRLASWAKCGYKPKLLFRVDNVPHAQRVERLTHYELIKEWRKERPCQAAKCKGTRHQEWFEISGKGAFEVVGRWVSVMKEADPYGPDAHLKPEWRQYMENAFDEGTLVTAQDLLAHHAVLVDGKAAQQVVAGETERTTSVKVEQAESSVYEVEETRAAVAGGCEMNKEESKETEEEDDRLLVVGERTESVTKKCVEADQEYGQHRCSYRAERKKDTDTTIKICEVDEEVDKGGHLSVKQEPEQPPVGRREAEFEETKIGTLPNAPATEKPMESRARRWRHDALVCPKLREGSAVLPEK